MLQFLRSHSVKLLILSYVILALLFSILWLNDRELLREQSTVIEASDQQIRKIHIIVELIEIARKRLLLSHEMLANDDVFLKDQISQEISHLGGLFIEFHNELMMLATDEERTFLNRQSELYPIVVGEIREVIILALEEDLASNSRAQEIIIDKIVPQQGIIINGFLQLLDGIQKEMRSTRLKALSDYTKNNNYRNALAAIILLLSLLLLLRTVQRLYIAEEKLRLMSLVDSLTGIANRRGFDERIELEWRRAEREKRPISVILIDVDYFKKYNDYYGHPRGDQTLIKIANEVKNLARRANDLASRYGGEEFAIILPGLDKAQAHIVALDLLENIQNRNIIHQKSEISDRVTVSIGVATITPSRRIKWEEIVRMADEALYASKKKGRNTVTSYQEQPLTHLAV